MRLVRHKTLRLDKLSGKGGKPPGAPAASPAAEYLAEYQSAHPDLPQPAGQTLGPRKTPKVPHS